MLPGAPLRLSEFCSLVGDALKQAFSDRAWWILAEIKERNDKPEAIFFELIEKAQNGKDIVARVTASVWRREAVMAFRNFEDITGKRPEKGMLVLVKASVSYHSVYGFSLQLFDIDSRHMLGQMELHRRRTIELLSQKPEIRIVDGIFQTPNKRLRMPKVIKRIAVITSASAAGYQDFNHELLKNPFGYQFYCKPYFSILQGERAAEQMKQQLLSIYNDCQTDGCSFDVVVIIRGGGAQSDLIPFDDFQLAHAVARFPIPVITGIGHLKDESITDMVANTATKTPTQAANLIVDRNRAFEEEIEGLRELIVLRLHNLVTKHQRKIDHAGMILTNGTRQLIATTENRISRVRERISSGAQKMLLSATKKIEETQRVLPSQARRLIEKQNHSLDLFTERMKLLHPENVLKRGYAMVVRNEQLIVSAEQVNKEEQLTVVLRDGTLTTIVTDKHLTEK
jgi:exodeoxyribonuclease VII large subunit